MGPIQSLSELLAMLRARAGLIALVSALGVLLSLAIALSTEAVYQARAIIQVQGSLVSDGDATSSGPATRRLQQIEQRIMSRDHLLALADRHDLFTERTGNERADLMRGLITLHSIAAVNVGYYQDGSIASLMVLARAGSPTVAADLANELADTIVMMSSDFRLDRLRDSLAFYRSEEGRLSQELSALEDEIEAFKVDNFDLLPANAAARSQELLQLEDSLRATGREIGALMLEIADLESRAARVTTQRRIAQLREQLEMRRIDERQLTEAIAELQPLLRRLPQVERELAGLERREEQLRARLLVTSERRAQAELGARLEDDQQVERFELLESAIVPEYPISRSRRVVAMAGAVASVGLALGLALMLEILNPVLRTPSQLERAMGMRPVLTIPAVTTGRQRARMAAGWLAGFVLLALAAMALALQLRLD
ncbi:MAG: hypothetical protein JJU42_04885 [Rhodobacteraceae bacterium]|nr:hypothetical protein [Paracoccaceae bacterium]